MRMGFIAVVWGLLVPWLIGRRMAMPLPIAGAATALLCSSYGFKIAGGVASNSKLERYQKMTRSALYVCTLSIVMPRASGVPHNPAVSVAAELGSRYLGMHSQQAQSLSRGFDMALEGALATAAITCWSRARALRRAMETSAKVKPKTT
jgi:hypothetical protein